MNAADAGRAQFDLVAAVTHPHPTEAIPLPPPEMRALIGGLSLEHFDNPSGGLVYPYLPQRVYDSVFDFGSGCGRLARRLIQQRPQPRRYLGIDVHRGMVRWCRANLTPVAPHFRFLHHDVFNRGLNPSAKTDVLPFPVEGESFSFVEAWSVFTHLTQNQAEHYLGEVSRILTPDGVFQSTWFLFDKSDFPVLQDFQNALYINLVDPSNAVIFDRDWLLRTTRQLGLVVYAIEPPRMRGWQWRLEMAGRESGVAEVEFPRDSAPKGRWEAPTVAGAADRIGLEDTGVDSFST
jgi:SAM-dependent methyltransferase